MQVAVEPFNFLLLPANIQYFSVLINGQLSKGCRFDALRDLRDTRLALLFWVRSIGKSGFRFWISDFGFPNKTRNPKMDFEQPKSFSKTDFN